MSKYCGIMNNNAVLSVQSELFAALVDELACFSAFDACIRKENEEKKPQKHNFVLFVCHERYSFCFHRMIQTPHFLSSVGENNCVEQKVISLCLNTGYCKQVAEPEY